MKNLVLLVTILTIFSCNVDDLDESNNTILNSEKIVSINYEGETKTYEFDQDLELISIEMENFYPYGDQFDGRLRFQFDEIQFIDFTPKVLDNKIIFQKNYQTSELNHKFWYKSRKFKLTFAKKM